MAELIVTVTVMFSLMFYRFKFLLLHSIYSIVSEVSISAVILKPHFSNCADLRQLQIPNANKKYYGIYLYENTSWYHSHNHVLNINTTLDIAKKNPGYFWTKVYIYTWYYACCSNQIPIHWTHVFQRYATGTGASMHAIISAAPVKYRIIDDGLIWDKQCDIN